jgi:hypothetical protein
MGPDIRDLAATMLSLPIRPNPEPPGWTPPTITPQAVDIASSTTPLTVLGKRNSTIGARIAAVSLLDCGFPLDKIVSRTGMAPSIVYF